MPRTKLLQLLHDYTPEEGYDRQCLGKFLDFVNTYSDCLERSLSIGHITGSAWIVDAMQASANVLLLHHRKLNTWLQPGGHADGEADVLNDVALREASEETGLQRLTPVSGKIFDLDIHTIPARESVPAHLHYDVRFAFLADPEEALTISPESNALQWVALNELESYSREVSILRMKRKWLSLTHGLS